MFVEAMFMRFDPIIGDLDRRHHAIGQRQHGLGWQATKYTMKHLANCAAIVALSVFLLAGCTAAVTTVDQSSYAVEESYVVVAHAEVTVLPTLSPDHQTVVRHFDALAYAAVVKLRRATQDGLATRADIEAASNAIQQLSDAVHLGDATQ
jgi:hypothetical protein